MSDDKPNTLHGHAEHRNTYVLLMVLPFLCTAKQARACGCQIPNTIPDHALYMPSGDFEWDRTKGD